MKFKWDYWNTVGMVLGIAACVFLLAACGGGGGGGGAQEPGPAPLTCSVELNGDSSLFGPFLDVRPSAFIAATLPSWTVEDRAAGGLSTEDLLNGYESTVPDNDPTFQPRAPQRAFSLELHPSRIIVMVVGANDGRELRPLHMIESELRQLIAEVRRQGKTPVVGGVVKVEAGRFFTEESAAYTNNEVAPMVNRVAEELGVTNARWDTVPYAGQSDTIDTVHRTQEASNKLAQRMVDTLKGVCQ